MSVADPVSATSPPAVECANEAIRRFMAARSGRPLWPEERAEYGRLLTAWAAAWRAGLGEAA